MKKLFLLSFYVFGRIGLSGCVGQLSDQSETTSKTEKTPQNTSEVIGTTSEQNSISTSSTLLESETIYKNTILGFETIIPQSWVGYKAFIYNFNPNLKDGPVARVMFAIPTISTSWIETDPNDPNLSVLGYEGNYKNIKGYFGAIGVQIWPYENFDKVVQMCKKDPNPGCLMDQESVLGKNDEYVYTLLYPQDAPDDVLGRSSENGIIKANFKLL